MEKAWGYIDVQSNKVPLSSVASDEVNLVNNIDLKLGTTKQCNIKIPQSQLIIVIKLAMHSH